MKINIKGCYLNISAVSYVCSSFAPQAQLSINRSYLIEYVILLLLLTKKSKANTLSRG